MRSAPLGWLLLLVAGLAAAGPSPADSEDAQPPSIAELLDRITAPGGIGDDGVDELVAREGDAEIVAATLERLRHVSGFHQRNALGYVLASHGEKRGLEILVDSLSSTGHLGYVYLTRVADVDFGWNVDGSSLPRWRAWLAGFTADEYRARVERSRLPFPIRRAGRAEFAAAATRLAKGEDRLAVAGAFREVAARFPKADLAAEARELADLLEAEAREDAAWQEPGSPESLSGPERLAWLVHHLRDATGRMQRPEGWMSVLRASGPGRGPGPVPGTRPGASPADDLAALGVEAVPVLLGLLEDRRPMRAVAPLWQGPIVLRYQDAALEILNRVLPPIPYERRFEEQYLSALPAPERHALIADVRTWAEVSAGKSGEDLLFAGLERMRTSEAVAALRTLAADPEKVPRVLDALRTLYAARSFVLRPLICELMAELGDTSKVAEVLSTLEAGRYTSHMILEEGDSAAGSNAERTAKRIRERFGSRAPESPVGEVPAGR